MARAASRSWLSDPAAQARVTHFRLAVGVLALVVACGTAGYMWIEDWPFLDALFMTVITISTVGFKEVHELSAGGRLLTIALIFGGVGTAGYAVGLLAQGFMGGEIRRILGRSKLSAQIGELKGHFVVCGLGKMGLLLCEELAEAETAFVVIDRDPARTALAEARGWLYVLGDASDADILSAAGIQRAAGLAAVLTTDADNVFVTLTARQLRRDLMVISRAEDPQSVSKLRIAGADRVVSSHAIGAGRIAQLILRPDVVDFVEVMTSRGRVDFQMDEIHLGKDSPLVGHTLRETRFRQESGATIIAVKRADGATTFNPSPDLDLKEGDVLIAIGPRGMAKSVAGVASRAAAERAGE